MRDSNGGRSREGDSPAILWLGDPLCRDAALTGNKAATLARLRGRGYAVPDGFCLTVPVVKAGSAAYRDQLREALQRLKPPWVARSSSNAEDSGALAFPGLFTTVLDLTDFRSVLAAVDQVAASARGAAVLTYASHHGFDPASVEMAVLIQTLVPAEIAGVAFSRDPVTGVDQVVIESNYGLGESVVDGSVTPDSVTLGADGTVLARSTGSKRQKVVVTTSGTRVRRTETSELEQSSHSLPDELARKVAAVTRDLERDLGKPVDVEWAITGKGLHVLQARPITTTGQPALTGSADS